MTTEIMSTILKVLGTAALLFVFIKYVLPALLGLIAALFGFRAHLRIAKLYGIDTAPIWAKAPRHIFCAWMEHNDYCVTLRSPDLSFHYRTGTNNAVTQNEPWLDQLATALRNGRTIMRLDVLKDGVDLQVNETLDCSIATLPGILGQDGFYRVMFLYPESPVMESVLGFDLQRMFKTVNYYMPGLDYVVVVNPRQLIDGKYNTIEYLSATNGTWIGSDHLAFKIPKEAA
jgi:hypothetical protein